MYCLMTPKQQLWKIYWGIPHHSPLFSLVPNKCYKLFSCSKFVSLRLYRILPFYVVPLRNHLLLHLRPSFRLSTVCAIPASFWYLSRIEQWNKTGNKRLRDALADFSVETKTPTALPARCSDQNRLSQWKSHNSVIKSPFVPLSSQQSPQLFTITC